MHHQELIAQFEDEIEDPDEETFLLYSNPIPSQNLGFIDPKAQSLDFTIAGRDFTIHQSPGVLSSHRAGGTTGAVVWKLGALFAEWLSLPSILYKTASITPSSSILELGCGISPLTALALAPYISSYTLTDQPYIQKLLAQNLTNNLPTHSPSRKAKSKPTPLPSANIRFKTLDWETDAAASLQDPSTRSFDAVIASDCVYNEALVRPFVSTCADVCRLRASEGEHGKPTLCIVAQQLRDDDVFRSWVSAFSASFRVWRMPDKHLPQGLRPGAGFVVHVGVLKAESTE